MKVRELAQHLSVKQQVQFQLEDGTFVPDHFHVTEMGLVLKNYVDCGGKMRNERSATFQLWVAGDTDHRLTPQKFLGIIAIADGLYSIQDIEVQVEYQQETIGVFDLNYNGEKFVLQSKQTACLAEDACGIPEQKRKVTISELKAKGSCQPGSKCC
ncbi:MAG: hypothetical protein RLY35_164 [Bacteroidota bacterium]|jgi:hypothetical protein